MSESCWYQTNMPNLWRYGRNRVRNLFYDPDADVDRLLDAANGEGFSDSRGRICAAAGGARKAITGSKRAI